MNICDIKRRVRFSDLKIIMSMLRTYKTIVIYPFVFRILKMGQKSADRI